jgi:hypothetical protein
MDTLDCIRAQRAEVEALLAYRHAAEGEARRLAWWRLHRARRARLLLLSEAERRTLQPLPPPPAGALGRLQALRLRIGLLTLERAAPPAPIARQLDA